MRVKVWCEKRGGGLVCVVCVVVLVAGPIHCAAVAEVKCGGFL